MTRPSTIKSKIVCFLPQDWIDFELAIYEAFPGAGYYKKSRRAGDAFPDGEEPPVITLKPSLLETEPDSHDVVIMVLDPVWQPEYEKYYRHYHHGAEWSWVLKGPSYPFVRFRLGGDLRDYKRQPPQYPLTGQIDFYGTPGDKVHAALARKFYRLFAKCATNRKGLVYVTVPELQVTHPVPPGAMEWCGYHAIAWARQAPDRVLHPTQGLAIRPADQ